MNVALPVEPVGNPPAAPPQRESGEGRILGVELLRFASALAVLVFHYQHFAFVGAGPARDFVPAAQPFYALLRPLYESGFWAVEVFWCLSGFIFFWKYGQVIGAGRLSGRAFFVLRLSRLYPLHLATLIAMAALEIAYFESHGTYFVYQHNDAYHFALQLGMASNWGWQVGDSFNGPIWSISVEVLVYAIFFLTLRYVSASPLFIAFVVTAAALAQVLKISEHPAVSCVMFFYLGCLTAIACAKARQRPAYGAAATAGALLIVAAALTLAVLGAVKPKPFLVLAVPSLIYICVAWVPASRGVRRFLEPAGNVTYSSYLLHVPLQLLVVLACARWSVAIPLSDPRVFIAYIGGVLLLSYWTYVYFEMPAQRLLRRRFLHPRPARTVPAGAGGPRSHPL